MFTRTLLHVTDSNKSDDSLQAAALPAECNTPTVLIEAKIDDNDDLEHDLDNILYNDLGGQNNKDSQIDNNFGNLHFKITDKDCLDVAIQYLFMLEMQRKISSTAEGRTEFSR
jgi:hypothetical protein